MYINYVYLYIYVSLYIYHYIYSFKQVREAQLAQYNFILVVGAQEMEALSVNIRTRDNQVQGTLTIPDLIKKFKKLEEEYL
jgi:threonyl-tRNA synthetase